MRSVTQTDGLVEVQLIAVRALRLAVTSACSRAKVAARAQSAANRFADRLWAAARNTVVRL